MTLLILRWQEAPSNPELQMQIPVVSSHDPWFEHPWSVPPGQSYSVKIWIRHILEIICSLSEQEVLLNLTWTVLVMATRITWTLTRWGITKTSIATVTRTCESWKINLLSLVFLAKYWQTTFRSYLIKWNLLINIMAFITATHQKRRERRVAAARRAIGAKF